MGGVLEPREDLLQGETLLGEPRDARRRAAR